MSHAAQWIFKRRFALANSIHGAVWSAFLSALLSVATTSGCATATARLEKSEKRGGPVSRVFYATSTEVEAGVRQAMIKYPQKVDNAEAGIFETDYVKGEARFTPAHKDNKLDHGYRYRILIRMVKGKAEGKPSVKVVVTKQIELARDFFSETESLVSDHYEENVILYRISREIAIGRALARVNEKSATTPAE